ncbi:MAG: stage II sporulation protein R [Lachnospiraceae bacterium]|nr:stage II sporulation protein R [Lachnospiraceae bacterium]
MKKICKKIMCGMIALCLLAAALQYRNSQLQQNIAEKILRFHVVANSNTKADQELKLKVRDKIGTYLQDKLQGVDNLAACIDIVENEKAAIENCAKEVITQEGYDYFVKAQIANVDFPVKTYGAYTFPAGNYQALKITIGSGNGENWWCVMYPNMCFANSVYEVIDEHSKEELRAVLTKEEYQELMQSGNIQISFKYIDNLLEKIRKK